MTRSDFNPRTVSCSAKEVMQTSCHHPLEGITRSQHDYFPQQEIGWPSSEVNLSPDPTKTHQECGFLCQSSTGKCQCPQVGFWVPMPKWVQNLLHSLDSWNGPNGSEPSYPSVWEIGHHAWDDCLLYLNLEPQGMGICLELANSNIVNNASSICCYHVEYLI